MALVAKGQITLVDLADGRSVQAFIETFTPQIQIYSPETQKFDPDWSVLNPVLIPSVYMTGTTNNLINRATVKWFKNGVEISSNDSNYIINPNTKTLTIKKNDMENEPYVDYSVEVTIKDTQTGIDMVSKSKINFAKVESGSGENAQNAFLTFPDGSVFKNASPGETKQIVLEYYDGGRKIIQNLDIKWFYQEPSVKEGDPNYHEDGGEGWSLISDTNNKNNGIRGYTGMNLTVSNHAVEGTESFKAVVQYGTKDKVTPIGTMIDITDPHQVIIEGNLAVRPEIQSTILFARTFLNGEAVTDLSDYKFSWYIYGADGELSKAWTQNSQSVEIEREDVPETGHIIVEVLKATEKVGTGTSPIFKVEDGQDGEKGDPGEPGKDGEKGEPGAPGEPGKDGKTYYTWVKYADTPTTGMSDSPDGKTYIGLAYNRTEETPSTIYQDYKWSLIKGKDGVQGPPGLDGKPKYTWVRYAENSDGLNMSSSPEGKKYLGLAFNKDTQTPSMNPSDYQWSLMPQNLEYGGTNLLSANPVIWEVGGIQTSTGSNVTVTNNTTLRTVKDVFFPIGAGTYTLTKYPNLKRIDIFLYSEETMTFVKNETTGLTDIGLKSHTTFKIEEDMMFRVSMVYLNNATVEDISTVPLRFKLERGEVSSDWSPAPEDQMSIEDSRNINDWLSELEEKTQPENIVNSILVEPGFSDIVNKPNMSDIEGLAAREELGAQIDYVQQLIGENGQEINRVNRELIERIDSIENTFSSQGGNNLIYNSTGWSDFEFWVRSGEVTVIESDLLTRLGFGKGFARESTASGSGLFYLEQSIRVEPNTKYSLSFWINKQTTTGTVGVEVYEGANRIDDTIVGKADGTRTTDYELALWTFTSSTGNIKIRLRFDAGSVAVITGLMLNKGDVAYHWQHAEGEVYNTNIKMNQLGIRVRNINTGGYTVMSPQEFSGYIEKIDENGAQAFEKVFTVNGETTLVKKLSASELFRLDEIAIRSFSGGWAFVKSNEENDWGYTPEYPGGQG